MPKKYRRRGGGFFDSLGQTFSNWGSTISQSAQGIYNKAKQGISGETTTTPYVPSYTPTTPAPINNEQQYNTATTTNYGNYGNYGGTKKRNRKNKRGAY
jgi:hypothetical protein